MPIDRVRSRKLLDEVGAEALVLFQPENFTYATGAVPGMAAMWRRGGPSIAVVPGGEEASIAVVIGDLHAQAVRITSPHLDIREHPTWIDTVDLRGIPVEGRTTPEVVEAGYRKGGVTEPFPGRPATYDLSLVLDLLDDVFQERKLTRVAADFEFLPVADFRQIQARLPRIEWIDGSEIVRKLRSVKSIAEIDLLTQGARLAESGVRSLVAGVRQGQNRADLIHLWRKGIEEKVNTGNHPLFTGNWDVISVGDDPWAVTGNVVPGALIKVDTGCLFSGYSSDSARTFSFGSPSGLARDIHSALLDAFLAGLAQIRPGNLLRDVYKATAQSVHRAGYGGFQRGHFGHGLGASVGTEEWPFISADSEVVIEPGMVLAFETPFYAKGIGAINIEDQIVVTQDGVEILNTLPRELVVID